VSRLPIRERILHALAARVSASRKLEMYDPRDLPITVIAEGGESSTPSYDMDNATLDVTIARAIGIEGDKEDEWHTEANLALADLIVEAFAGGDDLGGLARGMDYLGGSLEPLTDGSDGAAVQISVQVRYSFLHGNPYLQEEIDEEPDPEPDPEDPDEEDEDDG